jgi:hypothetical protein
LPNGGRGLLTATENSRNGFNDEFEFGDQFHQARVAGASM